MFLDIGGFDPSLYRRPAIEDIELGYRLSRSGSESCSFARDIQATHLKRWTLAIDQKRTDIFCRGVPWMLLMLRSRTAETDLNVSRSQRASVAATGMALATLPTGSCDPAAGGPCTASACLLAVGWLNRDFYRFLARTRSAGFALASFPIHLLYFCCCGLSVAIALALRFVSPCRAVGSLVADATLRTGLASRSDVRPNAIETPTRTEPAPWNDRP